jgi:4-alpha-glucanotransferase
VSTSTDERVLAEPARYDPETLADWLLNRNEQHRARLMAACESLRDAAEDRAAAHQRLAALVAARAAATPAP